MSVAPLIESVKAQVETQLDRGVNLRWNAASKVDAYVANLKTLLATFESRLSIAVAQSHIVETILPELTVCAFDKAAFKQRIAAIQVVVDTLTFVPTSHLSRWVADLNAGLADVFAQRLGMALEDWSTSFSRPPAHAGGTCAH